MICCVLDDLFADGLYFLLLWPFFQLLITTFPMLPLDNNRVLLWTQLMMQAGVELHLSACVSLTSIMTLEQDDISRKTPLLFDFGKNSASYHMAYVFSVQRCSYSTLPTCVPSF